MFQRTRNRFEKQRSTRSLICRAVRSGECGVTVILACLIASQRTPPSKVGELSLLCSSRRPACCQEKQLVQVLYEYDHSDWSNSLFLSRLYNSQERLLTPAVQHPSLQAASSAISTRVETTSRAARGESQYSTIEPESISSQRQSFSHWIVQNKSRATDPLTDD